MRKFVSRTHWRTTASFLASHLTSPLFINIRSHRFPATVHTSLRGVENHRCHVHKLAESSPASNKPSPNKLPARCRIIIKGAAVVGDIPNLRGRVRSLGQHTSSSRPGATNLFDQGYFEGVRFACNPRRNRNSSTSDFCSRSKRLCDPCPSENARTFTKKVQNIKFMLPRFQKNATKFMRTFFPQISCKTVA